MNRGFLCNLSSKKGKHKVMHTEESFPPSVMFFFFFSMTWRVFLFHGAQSGHVIRGHLARHCDHGWLQGMRFRTGLRGMLGAGRAARSPRDTVEAQQSLRDPGLWRKWIGRNNAKKMRMGQVGNGRGRQEMQ